jgi:hypothetical protein
MPDVFVNYRTGDGDKSAALIERDLSHRFGSDKIFRASKSIPPGARFPQELLGNVRRSAVLLAVIGETWIRCAALHDEDDWVRREIVEALTWGIPVVPVLEGRKTERLCAAELPDSLAQLAEVQSLRLDLHNADAGLRRIGDEIAKLIPSLKDADRAARRAAEPGATHNSVGDVQGTTVQARDFTGDVGTVVKGNHGPVHTGTGDIHQSHFSGDHNHFSGDGATYIAGDNRGGVRHRFGGSHREEGNGR